MPGRKQTRAEKNGLHIDLEELEDDLAEIEKRTQNEKGDRQAANCIFHFKAFLYKNNKRDLLTVPRGVLDWSTRGIKAFVDSKREEQEKMMSRIEINYVPFTKPNNAYAFGQYKLFLCSRKRSSHRPGASTIPISVRGMDSYNTAIANDMTQRAHIVKTQSFMVARKRMMTMFKKLEQKLRQNGEIKATVGADVVPLDLHDQLCRVLVRSTDPSRVKLHLITLLAFS